jgi:hypothetical protein
MGHLRIALMMSVIDVKKAQRKALGKFSFIPKREEGSVKKTAFYMQKIACSCAFF